MSPEEMLLDSAPIAMSESQDPRRPARRVSAAPGVPPTRPARPVPEVPPTRQASAIPEVPPTRQASRANEVLSTNQASPANEVPSAIDAIPAPEVPPVRTIVLDRPPVAVVPPQEREALRASSSTGPERLRLEDVSIDYGAKQAVKSVSLSIHQGEVLALIGPSGCGKTTLLRTLNRLTELTPSASRAGRVLLDGEDIHELADTTLRARVAMVFQQPNPFPMSIFDNVAFALREQSRKRPRRRELDPLVVDALRRAGLYEEVRDDLDRPALRLSGGQQQRLCIARAIAPRPEVLLMDEPCSALDPISTGVIEKLIGELRRELAVVVVTHNLAQAHRVADKVAFMYLGDLIEYGSTSDVFDEPRASRTRDYVRGAFG